MDRKGFYKFSLIPLLMTVLSLCAEAQNLVPNPSFEEYSECPESSGKIAFAYPWKNVRVSCDYYHTCGTNGVAIPVSEGGGGYARTGLAYAGFKVWYINSRLAGREVLGIELLETLVEGVPYRVEFYLSMMDSIWYASKNVGAYFSAQQPNSDIDSIESYQPQVRYEGDFITDKQGWTRVSGSFVAQGGERFLSIGNFDKYEETETLFVPGGGVNPSHSDVYWKLAAYFIDDVSVVPDSITGINDELGMKNDEFSVYPNPNNGRMMVNYTLLEGERGILTIYNTLGELVFQRQLNDGLNQMEIDVMNMSSGIYLLNIDVNKERKLTERLSILRE